jgi:hypothetical protein
MASQMRGEIVYRVCEDIPNRTEMLTYYGDDYARSLDIDPKRFRGKKGSFLITEEVIDEACEIVMARKERDS